MIKTVTSKRVKLRQFTSKRVIGLNCFSLGASSYVSLRQNAVPPRMTAFVNAQELLFGGSGMCKKNIPHCVVALPLPLSSTVFFVSAFLPFFTFDILFKYLFVLVLLILFGFPAACWGTVLRKPMGSTSCPHGSEGLPRVGSNQGHHDSRFRRFFDIPF